jgi:AcrR family transcriptional regulator
VNAKSRAVPLAREDRRAAILDAVVPLLLENGANVTTAQMAEAAGIAEGTIFRAFADKAAVLHEAVRSSLDPSKVVEDIAAIDRGLSLDDQLRAAAEIIVGRFDRVQALIGALRSFPHTGERRGDDVRRAAMEANSRILGSLTRLLGEHAEELAVEPERAAIVFRGLLYAVGFPHTDPSERMTIDEVVSVMTGGVTKGARP